jgi:uncharacterized membrane protein (UPF0127 family)
MKPLLSAVACFLLAAAAAASAGGCQQTNQPQVTIRDKTWSVELATTSQQRMHGLAGREALAADAGMLFIFPDSAVRYFWMQGCFIPLDVAFLDEHRRVVGFGTMAAEPNQVGRVVYTSPAPAKYALEVNAGALAAAGVKVGDVANFSGEIPR